MLAKNSFYYLFAHGIPSLINFSAVIIYTRMLMPDEYGQYALVIAAVSFFNMFLPDIVVVWIFIFNQYFAQIHKSDWFVPM